MVGPLTFSLYEAQFGGLNTSHLPVAQPGPPKLRAAGSTLTIRLVRNVCSTLRAARQGSSARALVFQAFFAQPVCQQVQTQHQ